MVRNDTQSERMERLFCDIPPLSETNLQIIVSSGVGHIKPIFMSHDPLSNLKKRWKNLKKRTEASEIERLTEVYKELPPKQLAVAQGLIVQAARLRIRLDKLWDDLTEHGETEWFTQSKDAPSYERERPASRTFTATDKSYQSIIKQLNDMIPKDVESVSGLELDLDDI